MKYRYVITMYECNTPIYVVDNFEDVKLGIYEYNAYYGGSNTYNVEYDEFIKNLKFIPFGGKYPDANGYDGDYEYTSEDGVEKYRVYCSDVYIKKPLK